MCDKKFTHIGWVPCISGHLFFEFTGCGLGRDSLIVEVHNVERHASSGDFWRYVVIASNKNWQDDNDSAESGLYKVVLAANAAIDANSMTGSVYICPAGLTIADNIDLRLRNIKASAGDRDPVGAHYSDVTQYLNEKDSSGVYRIDFCIDQSGFVRLGLVSRFRDEKLGAEQDAFRRAILIRQAYYYIKFSWHRHQHHSDTAESLTTVHPIDVRGTHGDTLAMINDLKRALVQLKRDSHISEYRSLYQAEGIATYAKSLIVSACRAKMLEREDAIDQEAYFENVAKSLSVKIKVVEQELTTRGLVSSNFRSLLLFFLSIVAPVSLVFRDKIASIANGYGESPAIVLFLGHLFGSGYKMVAMGAVCFTLYFAYRKIYLSFGSPLLALRWVRDLLDVIVAERYKAQIIAIFLIGGAVGLLALVVYRLVDG